MWLQGSPFGADDRCTRTCRRCGAVSMDGGRYDVDLRSDLADSQARADQVENLLLLRRADRTAGRVADAAGRRGLAPLLGRRYARRVRLRSYLTRDEALTEGEQG